MAKAKRKMSAALKTFLKTHGRFPKKGELGRSSTRSSSRGSLSKPSKSARVKAFAKRQGVGGFLHKGKWFVVAFGHAVSQLRRNGTSPLALNNVLSRYFGLAPVPPTPRDPNGGWTFSVDYMKPHVSGLLTFTADDWGKRKTGHYRRVSRGNIFPAVSEGVVAFLAINCGGSGVGQTTQQLLPADIDWGRALECYQDYISGYDPGLIGSDGLPGNYDWSRRWKDQAAITYTADGLSWLASKMGLNKYLPKKVNF